MAFSDPLYIRYNGAVLTSPLTDVQGSSRTYSFNTGNTATGWGTMTISHVTTSKGRVRRLAKVSFKKITADLLVTGKNIERSMSCSFIVDTLPEGFTVAEAQLVSDALTTWLINASSSAVANSPGNAQSVTRLLGGES